LDRSVLPSLAHDGFGCTIKYPLLPIVVFSSEVVQSHLLAWSTMA